MPALNPMYRQQWANDTYKRLRVKGLKHQQALVPIMRKLLLRILSVKARNALEGRSTTKSLTNHHTISTDSCEEEVDNMHWRTSSPMA